MNTIVSTVAVAAPVSVAPVAWTELDAARAAARRAADIFIAAKATEDAAIKASYAKWCETYDLTRSKRERARAPFVAAKAVARDASWEALRASSEANQAVRSTMEAGGLRFYGGGGSGLLFHGEEVKGYRAAREVASRIAPREGEAALCLETGDAWFLSSWVIGPVEKVRYAYPKRYAECARRR